jgi:hypothetical protein
MWLAGVRRALEPLSALAAGADAEASAAALFLALEVGRQESQLLRRNRLHEIEIRGVRAGIGLELDKDPRERRPASPQAGLRAGDRIPFLISQTGVSPDTWQCLGTVVVSLADCEDFLRGRPESAVHLFYWRDDIRDLRRAVVRRQTVTEETVFGVRRDAADRWDFMLDGDPSIAYVRIKRFDPATGDELARAFRACQARRARALILDLRFCPRSLISGAVRLTELLAGQRRLLSLRGRFQRADYDDEEAALWASGPIACLDNEWTASSPEVMVATLQDYGLAVVVGTRTAGAVEIHNIMPVPGDWELKLPTAVLTPPSGRNLSRLLTAGTGGESWGVRPDLGGDVPLMPGETDTLARHLARLECIDPPHKPTYDRTAFRDRQLDRARELLRAKLGPAR